MRAIDTSVAMEVIAKAEEYGTVVPSNITPGPFVQLAADNNDLNEETLDARIQLTLPPWLFISKSLLAQNPLPLLLRITASNAGVYSQRLRFMTSKNARHMAGDLLHQPTLVK